MHINGNSLAFLGDAVLSLQVRKYLIELGIRNPKKLQEKSTDFVSAKAQANFISYLLDKEILVPEELNMYRKGRNAKSSSSAKNADIITYRMATGMESLWGYLYLNHAHERLNELWLLFIKRVEESC